MFLWIVIVGGISSFIASMGIGSNDAANAFATSVGSKALTIKQAAALAVIFETGGAILMGNHVTDTIRKGIADYQCFENNPELFMYGCMCVIISVSFWLFLASYLEMPVSTTHSCVGGMIGMTIAIVGSDCVIWYESKNTFPYVGGVIGIILSWFISPIFSAISSALIFSFSRCLVLRSPYESNRINILYPLLVSSTLLINSFFIIYKGAKGLNLHNIEASTAILISFGISSAGGLITILFVPKIKKIIHAKFEKRTTNTIEVEVQEIQDISNNQNNLNINSQTQLDKIINIHKNAERFDPKIEELFKYLQIFTASCDAFSHGANDVANSIGPFVAIFIIYRQQENLTKKIDMGDDAYWILGMGGIGIALGLILYGKKIVHAIGNKLCKITPSRGTCIELGSALVIITGSRLKIPLSTTHCQVGAEVGVALCEKHHFQAINKKILFKTLFGWIITCVFVGFSSGVLTAQGAYSHSPKLLNNTC